MEDARKSLELVHVLRHSFRPSQPLEEAIENFVKPGKTLPRLLLYGTKQVALDMQAYNDYLYKDEEALAREAFKKHTDPIYVGPKIHARALGTSAVRFGFLPAPQSTIEFYSAIHTIDETVPNILAHSENKLPRYFMYIDIPMTHIDNENYHEHYTNLQRVLAAKSISKMYSVKPDDIIGQDGKRFIIPADTDDPQDPYLGELAS